MYTHILVQIASGNIPLASALVDETTLCADAFKIMQYIADNWVKDAKNYGNAHADRLQVCMYVCMCVCVCVYTLLSLFQMDFCGVFCPISLRDLPPNFQAVCACAHGIYIRHQITHVHITGTNSNQHAYIRMSVCR